jgi:hypothetical protein
MVSKWILHVPGVDKGGERYQEEARQKLSFGLEILTVEYLILHERRINKEGAIRSFPNLTSDLTHQFGSYTPGLR